ncbi:hypothetical protein PPSIR1_11575 [Plesiocystis pacifica SIR-1]|uniref:Mce/MlaD domain-containing protein n=1 Tax=Plesiocystis pacifica SIR-1 TaxID=391625 RepID=A6G1B8_9BACT|nr:hypothetical protein [Plesiocystis pacifica]EDM80413.1 hypothetical protein PPSIR1_11575 [Plesiocystis pacifica SIR-1]
MASRKQQRRVNALVALFALVMGGVMAVSMVVIASSEGLWRSKTHLHADFRDAGSIGKNTRVQLAGKEIGRVLDVAFVTERYPCDPNTEDWGRPGHGRSDDCEPWLFCAPVGRLSVDQRAGLEEATVQQGGVCGELEEFSGRSEDYEGCQGPNTCGPGRLCVTQAFRQRYRGVRWWGQDGWCVDFEVESQRIRVSMEVDDDSLQYMREDSRASVVLNGPLSSPRVNISVGARGAEVVPGDRIQTKASLTEEALGLKDQIDRIAADIERGLIGLSALTDALTDEKAQADIESMRENLAAISTQMETAMGMVGAVLNDPTTRSELSQTLREVRQAASDAQGEYESLEGRVKRTIRGVQRAADEVNAVVEGLDDPANTSLVAVMTQDHHGLDDSATRLSDNVEDALGTGRGFLADVESVLGEVNLALDNREGTLGRLWFDGKPLYHLKDPATMRRVNVVKTLVRWVTLDEPGEARAEAADEAEPATANTDTGPDRGGAGEADEAAARQP